MRITIEADYALRIVFFLAKEKRRCEAREISGSLGIPPRYCLKIMRQLVAGEIVSSRQGTGGGYELCCDAQTLTMRRVIEQIDGPFQISHCLKDDYLCTRVRDPRGCTFHRIFEAVNTELAAQFDRITIGMVADERIPVRDILALITNKR